MRFVHTKQNKTAFIAWSFGFEICLFKSLISALADVCNGQFD